MSTITTTEKGQEKRAKEIANALASVRLEGLEPSVEAKAIFQRYVDGEIDSAEMGRSIDALLEREYGPLRLPRNERS